VDESEKIKTIIERGYWKLKTKLKTEDYPKIPINLSTAMFFPLPIK